MSAVAVRVSLVVAAALLGAGCGHADATPDSLDGKDVGTMAEHELEAENPRLAPGALACPDLELEVGASVSCVRTAELPEGRVVKVHGTVEVTSVAAGGRLHVAMDDDATAFGVSGEHVAADVRREYAARHHVAPTVDCPYLAGRAGARVVCRLVVGGIPRAVDVVVTAVDPVEYRTTYVARAHGPS